MSRYTKEADRHTERIDLRLQPEVAKLLRAKARARRMLLNDYVAMLVRFDETLRDLE